MRHPIKLIIILILLLTLTACGQPTLEAESVDPVLEKNETKESLILEDHNVIDEKSLDILEDFAVITIGSGTPDYSEEKAKASTAIKYKDKYYIVDCGDGTYSNMEEVDFDFKNISGILFTHHHLDHTTDFFDLYAKCFLKGAENLQVIGPPRTSKFIEFVNEVYLDDLLYRKINTTKDVTKIDKESFVNYAEVTEVVGMSQLVIDGMEITTAEMSHTMYNLAYKFEADGRSIVISGDTSFDQDLIALSKDADILVLDGALYKENTLEQKTSEKAESSIEPFYEYGGDFSLGSHMTFEDILKLASETNVKTLVLTHYGDVAENRIKTSIEKIGEVFDGNVVYATDMLTIGVAKQDDFVSDKESVETIETEEEKSYPIVDTNQKAFYSDAAIIEEPSSNDPFYGQDATYPSNPPSYTDNGDGTVTDHVTGLIWAKDMGEKMTYESAMTYATESSLGGYDDWRLPTIKELYSLIQFDGLVMGENASDKLFIDTVYFNQPLGDVLKGEREIDAQTWSSTIYAGETMAGDKTVFGVNFVDGRIKGYPMFNKRSHLENQMYFRLVRGNAEYGQNNYVDNRDGTISDLATGLTWLKEDSGVGMTWEEALAYAENLEVAGYGDWRLPDAKELQSIVDYERSLQETNSPAIDPVFETTSIVDMDGHLNYPYFWSSTSHLDGKNPYNSGVYIAFGEAQGVMNETLMDVHGAGAQRSDPKSGKEEHYPQAFGPQGDIRYVYNFVRCVRTTD